MSGQAETTPPGLRPLGRSACQVSEIGLGAAALGNLYAPVGDPAARELVDFAWSAGIRLFDTAPYYGFGLSERRLGDALRPRLGEAFCLSTKVGRLLLPDPAVTDDELRHGFRSPLPFQPAYDYSYDGIMRSVEHSRQRLGLARIDVLLVHDIGRLTHGEQHAAHLDTLRSSGYRALETLRAAGEVAAIGLGVNEWQVCDEALDWGAFDCFLLAGRYTLLEQAPLTRFLPRCAAAGTSLILGGVFNSGILAVGTGAADQPLHYDYAPADPDVIARVRALEDICRAWSVALPAAALQFPIAHPQVAAILCGARSAGELATSLRHYRSPIPPGFWRDLKSAGLIATAAPVPAGLESTA